MTAARRAHIALAAVVSSWRAVRFPDRLLDSITYKKIGEMPA
jgi:hypothetical protein